MLSSLRAVIKVYMRMILLILSFIKTCFSNFVFAISKPIQHRNLKIRVPTPHDYQVIMWGQEFSSFDIWAEKSQKQNSKKRFFYATHFSFYISQATFFGVMFLGRYEDRVKFMQIFRIHVHYVVSLNELFHLDKQ